MTKRKKLFLLIGSLVFLFLFVASSFSFYVWNISRREQLASQEKQKLVDELEEKKQLIANLNDSLPIPQTQCDIEEIKSSYEKVKTLRYYYSNANKTYTDSIGNCTLNVYQYITSKLAAPSTKSYKIAYLSGSDFILADESKDKINVFKTDLFDVKRVDLFSIGKQAAFSSLEDLYVSSQFESIVKTGSGKEVNININDQVILRIDALGGDCNNDQSCNALLQETLIACQKDSGVYIYDLKTQKLLRAVKPEQC